MHEDPCLARRLDSGRESPLSYASQGGYLHIVRLLLEHGADPNIAEGDAPDGLVLYLACAGNHLEVARLLLEHGANPNAGLDGCQHRVNITRVYHGEQAKPLEQFLRHHGSYTQQFPCPGQGRRPRFVIGQVGCGATLEQLVCRRRSYQRRPLRASQSLSSPYFGASLDDQNESQG